ncbi:MAG: peptidylprolyl isomerase [Sterolibacterium sp.]
MKHWFVLFCIILVTACMDNGGNTTTVTDIQAQNLRYGQRATFVILGSNLDLGGLSVNAANCIGQTPVSKLSVQQVMVCTITAAGDLVFQIVDGAGTVVFSKIFAVPAPQVTLTTSMGIIVVELNPLAAPITVKNFIEYVQIGYYKNTLFHRVIPGFVIQGGGYSHGLAALPALLAPITLESNKGLSNLRGTIAMARMTDPNSATTQFYFNLADNLSLDYRDANNPGYAVFGKIVQGLDVMDAIGTVTTSTQGNLTDVPVTDVVVQTAVQTQ